MSRIVSGFRGSVAVVFVFVAAPAFAGDRIPSKIEFNRDVRPILAENCFQCHGPDSAARKADLRFDKRDVAIELGAITPGKLEESTLVERIDTTKADELMPPPKTKKVLKPEEKEILKRWIASGAEYQPHWSFLAPKRPEIPKVQDESWVRNPIDRFILAALERRGLKPAPEADRRTLARRLSLDLTGLPPLPEDVEAFVNDKAPDAYERLVDRYMASDHWGEHRGRYWLDAARYADTHGIHFDNYRENWAYRDWVIDAFNHNVPFDVFTTEQLAGDLLPNRTIAQQIASGFNRCNITTNEGGAINEEYLVLYTRDRTETASQIWLGMTTGCAVCHDHKFDPLSQREFYELAAFFNNTTQNAMDGNIKDTPPTLMVPRPEDRPRWDALAKEIAAVKPQVEAKRQAAVGDLLKRLAGLPAGSIASKVPSQNLRLLAPLSEGQGTATAVISGGSWRMAEVAKVAWQAGHVAAKGAQFKPGATFEIPEAGDFEKDQAFSYGAWVNPPRNNAAGAYFGRMDERADYRGWDLWSDGGKPATHIIHKWPDDAIKVIGNEPLRPGVWSHVFVTYDGSGKASGVKIYVNGQPQGVSVFIDKLTGSIKTTVPLTLAQRTPGSRLDNAVIQDLRIYAGALPPEQVASLATSTRAAYLASKPADKRTDPDKSELTDWLLVNTDDAYKAIASRLVSLEADKSSLQARGTTTPVSQEKDGMAMAYVLNRGDYDKRKDPVKPGTPAILPPMPPDLPRNRLGLAKWLLREENPMPARVTVNRFWQELFGTGIVKTSGDFGTTGELPSHPELLDWLALEFRGGNWDIKRFYKLLVTSATYRQSTKATPEKLEKDHENRFLSRGPRFRMDAEMVRDYALAAGGLLVERTGGPSVKPYQPDGVWEAVAMPESNTRYYKQDSGEKLYRRSMYTFWKRAAPPASMDIFNAPNRETCTVRRERTNTPLQALVTLNDPQFVEAARHLAELTIKSGTAPAGRIQFMAARLLARPLSAEEESIVKASFADLQAYYQGHPADAAQLIAVGESKPDASVDAPSLAAWTMLANELLNLDEVLNK